MLATVEQSSRLFFHRLPEIFVLDWNLKCSTPILIFQDATCSILCILFPSLLRYVTCPKSTPSNVGRKGSFVLRNHHSFKERVLSCKFFLPSNLFFGTHKLLLKSNQTIFSRFGGVSLTFWFSEAVDQSQIRYGAAWPIRGQWSDSNFLCDKHKSFRAKIFKFGKLLMRMRVNVGKS